MVPGVGIGRLLYDRNISREIGGERPWMAPWEILGLACWIWSCELMDDVWRVAGRGE